MNAAKSTGKHNVRRTRRSAAPTATPVANARVHRKTQLAGETWTRLFGPLAWSRFTRSIRPLFLADEPLGRVERAMRAYREAHQDRAIALEWFVGDYQRWANRGDASALDEWGGYARAAGIADLDAYRAAHLHRIALEDEARERDADAPSEVEPNTQETLL